MTKRPKHRKPPKHRKQAETSPKAAPTGGRRPVSQQFDEGAYQQARPAWRVSKLEEAGPFGWNQLDGPKAAAVVRKLKAFESMRWSEILIGAKKQNHSVLLEDLSKTAQTRLQEILFDDRDELVSLHLLTAQLLWDSPWTLGPEEEEDDAPLSVRVWFNDRPEPFEFLVDQDISDEMLEDRYELKDLVLCAIADVDTMLHFEDSDGEQVFLRRENISLLTISLAALYPSLINLEEEERGTRPRRRDSSGDRKPTTTLQKSQAKRLELGIPMGPSITSQSSKQGSSQ